MSAFKSDYINTITLEQDNIRKRSKIDFSKKSFTEAEMAIIKKEASVIKEKYPTHVPIIISVKDNKIVLSKRKFLVGGDVTIGQFMYILRKKIDNLKSSEAIFLFVNNTIPPSTMTLLSIYSTNKDKNTDMLFITVCKENTFGKLV